ncbi:hypothetical protein [Pseudomonas gingeri]|uniref:Uncharacterized protein n=1 Tax=Pseudomonas gingeri TaxID=117681 RepID=A0A7Y7YG11_9PSED|nr:hypothetical protein [Pseudomonas gingeri]NWB31307.1 hypothetical protein [Pseudomonas gingeri]NWC35829.1 hypothetical protein [Pseudomonas gingeri]NWD06292.1 hypothetical protein [Pseudomonas gingeri]NWD49335.1 hypothetical protein [Pseudomonas gingeri]NWE26804.1 hypothetical protein [Pseudomonas gingeri]
MTRYLRLCLLLVISLALPLSGMAGVRVSTEPCPMETSGKTAMMDGMGPDCCQDAKNGTSEHGKLCKPGQECKTGNMLQVSVVKTPVTLSLPVVISFSGDLSPVQAPSGVWRPPRV